MSDVPKIIEREALIKAIEALGFDPHAVRSFAFIPNTDPKDLACFEIVLFKIFENGAKRLADDGNGFVKETFRIPVI